jgi:hypothetical protein
MFRVYACLTIDYGCASCCGQTYTENDRRYTGNDEGE